MPGCPAYTNYSAQGKCNYYAESFKITVGQNTIFGKQSTIDWSSIPPMALGSVQM